VLFAFRNPGTYPQGMLPTNTVIVENYRGYKNSGGVFQRRSANFLFKGKNCKDVFEVLVDTSTCAVTDNFVHYLPCYLRNVLGGVLADVGTGYFLDNIRNITVDGMKIM
jgi:hypothetical protein